MQTLVRIKLWDQTVRTQVSRNKGKTPIWNQNLIVEKVNQSKNRNVAVIEIWQNDEWNSNMLLGYNTLNIDELGIFGEKKKTSRWIDLKDEDLGIGKVLINFEWRIQERKVNLIKDDSREEKIKMGKEKIAKNETNKKNITNSKKCKRIKFIIFLIYLAFIY